MCGLAQPLWWVLLASSFPHFSLGPTTSYIPGQTASGLLLYQPRSSGTFLSQDLSSIPMPDLEATFSILHCHGLLCATSSLHLAQGSGYRVLGETGLFRVPVAHAFLLVFAVAAFFLSSNVNPVQAVAAMPAGVGSLTSPLFKGLNPLTFLLTTLGVPVDHLLDGTQKCVDQLGPEALQAVKALKRLLVMWALGTCLPCVTCFSNSSP